MKRRRVNNRPIWMKKNVLRVIRKKKRLWRAYKETREHREFEAYKKVENEVKKVVRNAKKKFEKKLAKDSKKNPRAFWGYLKSKTANRQSVGPLKDYN